jgi:hypothetical protein
MSDGGAGGGAASKRYRFAVLSSRVVRIVGLVVGGAALVFALLPFSATYVTTQMAPARALCDAPVVEATRTPAEGGWFGYAPLTSTPLSQGHLCHDEARHRLIVSAGGLFVAALLGWVSARLGGDSGPLGRRRWRPEPV